MSMSDPFLPAPSEDGTEQEEGLLDDLDRDEQPDVLAGADEHDADEAAAAADAAEPDLFRTPHAGDHLTAEQLEAELD